jgi:hypothetical protein
MFTVELYAGVRRAVMVTGLANGMRQSGLAFIATRFRRCCSFLSNHHRAWSDLSNWTGKPTARKTVEEVLRHVHRSCLAPSIPGQAVVADACCEGRFTPIWIRAKRG